MPFRTKRLDGLLRNAPRATGDELPCDRIRPGVDPTHETRPLGKKQMVAMREPTRQLDDPELVIEPVRQVAGLVSAQRVSRSRRGVDPRTWRTAGGRGPDEAREWFGRPAS